MGVLDYADSFNATATRLAWQDSDPPDWFPENPAVTFPVLVLELGAEEATKVGKSTAKEVVKLLCDLNSDLSSPATEQHRVQVEGWGTYDLFSVTRLVAEGEAICTMLGEAYG